MPVPGASWIFADSQPGMDTGTNEAMPRFGGRVDPGQQVVVSIDGQKTGIAPTAEGTWTYTAPELANGEHEFEMWVEDAATGERGPATEWTNNIDANAQDRAAQRARNQEFNRPGGSGEKFIDDNDQLARDARRPQTGGGGGGGGQPMTDPPPPGGSGSSGSATGTGTGTQGDGPATAQGLEKGNSGVAIAR